jgi:hypothetical protein
MKTFKSEPAKRLSVATHMLSALLSDERMRVWALANADKAARQALMFADALIDAHGETLMEQAEAQNVETAGSPSIQGLSDIWEALEKAGV